jgi:hypothetical protein
MPNDLLVRAATDTAVDAPIKSGHFRQFPRLMVRVLANGEAQFGCYTVIANRFRGTSYNQIVNVI